MFIHNRINILAKGFLVFLMLSSKIVCPLETNQEKFSNIISSKGLEIKLIKDKNVNFIHAELIIFYKDKNVNPIIRHLTMLNIFDEDVNRSGSGLLSTLRKLGNDFEVFNRPDYLLFKINFLQEKLATFMQFLKGLYSYKAFTLKKFNYSVYNYRKLLVKGADWKKRIAIQVAYQKLFPGHPLGNSLIIPGSINKINLAHIRSYYQRTYTLTNSLLIMKGNLKQVFTVGSFNIAFKSFKKQDRKESHVKEKLKINHRREVIIYHINTTSSPEIFWFETIPPLVDKSHIPSRVLNDMLFGQPLGRLSQIALNNGMRSARMETDVINHEEVSVICNTISRISYKDLDKFIRSVDTEKKRLKRIQRREYLDVKNYFCGRLKVDTRRFAFDVEFARDFSFFNRGDNHPLVSISQISQQVTLESLNSVTTDLSGGTIVFLGNANLIVTYLKSLKPRVIRYIQ